MPCLRSSLISSLVAAHDRLSLMLEVTLFEDCHSRTLSGTGAVGRRHGCCLRLLTHEGRRGGRLNLEVPFNDVELGPIVAQLLFKPYRPRHLACHYNTSETPLIIVGVEEQAMAKSAAPMLPGRAVRGMVDF